MFCFSRKKPGFCTVKLRICIAYVGTERGHTGYLLKQVNPVLVVNCLNHKYLQLVPS